MGDPQRRQILRQDLEVAGHAVDLGLLGHRESTFLQDPAREKRR